MTMPRVLPIRDWADAEPSLTYAIGDIHGCFGQLRALLDLIEEHRGGRPRRLVFLGDYIDRGPDTAAVVACLRRLQSHEPDDVVCLAGNHEDMLLQARHDRESFWHWIQNGGRAVLESYDVNHIDALPDEDVAWLASLPTLHQDRQRYFVHAGLRPGKPIEPEDRMARLWIRDRFLRGDYDFGKHVVHGHTPQASGVPEVRRYRTNLDTACVYGRALTAGVFTDEQGPAVAFLAVGHSNVDAAAADRT
jgi:serine/threonine protein phosphatase 1